MNLIMASTPNVLASKLPFKCCNFVGFRHIRTPILAIHNLFQYHDATILMDHLMHSWYSVVSEQQQQPPTTPGTSNKLLDTSYRSNNEQIFNISPVQVLRHITSAHALIYIITVLGLLAFYFLMRHGRKEARPDCSPGESQPDGTPAHHSREGERPVSSGATGSSTYVQLYLSALKEFSDSRGLITCYPVCVERVDCRRWMEGVRRVSSGIEGFLVSTRIRTQLLSFLLVCLAVHPLIVPTWTQARGHSSTLLSVLALLGWLIWSLLLHRRVHLRSIRLPATLDHLLSFRLLFNMIFAFNSKRSPALPYVHSNPWALIMIRDAFTAPKEMSTPQRHDGSDQCRRRRPTNATRRRRRLAKLLRSALRRTLRPCTIDSVRIRLPLSILPTSRTRPGLRGGSQPGTTILTSDDHHSPFCESLPPLDLDEDWYPLYLLEVSRHIEAPPDTVLERPILSRAAFTDMTTQAWQTELRAMDIRFDTPEATIAQLLPAAPAICAMYQEYDLPILDIPHLPLEEVLCHIRVVFRRISRLTQKRKKLIRELANLHRRKQPHQKRVRQEDIDKVALDLHRVRRALAQHNVVYQQLARKTKTRVKETYKRMPRQVFVNLDVPTLPTFNRFAILSDHDAEEERAKSWSDFMPPPQPPTAVGAFGEASKPIPLHKTPPRQTPMEAMAQLRRDLTAVGDNIAYHAPNASHDVRGWYTVDTPEQVATITVASWNINGLDSYKARFITMMMLQDKIDVMIVPDTRHSDKTSRSYKRLFTALLGPGTRVYCSKDSKRRPSEPGGIIIVVGPKWGLSYISDKSRTDYSGQGALAQIFLRTETGTITILGTYWPECPSDSTRLGPGHKGLWSRILAYRNNMKAHNPNPIVYLQELILQWISLSRQQGCQGCVVGGDLNSTWLASEPGGQRTIQKWCDENCLINGPRQIHDELGPPINPSQGIHHHFITWGRTEWTYGTWIDHILHTGDREHIDIVGACNSFGAEIDDVSDHKPIWGLYRTAKPAAATVIPLPKSAPRPELSRSDPRQIAVFKSRLADVLYQIPHSHETLAEAEEALEHATRFTVHLVRMINEEFGKTNKCHKHKDGCSPEFMLRKWHLGGIIELKRHLLGQHGKTRWTSQTAIQRGIYYIFDSLKARASGMGLPRSRIDRILSTTHKDMQYWLALTSGPTPALCDLEIRSLRKLLHGRKRMEMRKASQGYSSWVEHMREIGKTGKVIKAILGVHAGRRHKDGLTIDSLTLPNDEVTGDPQKIHESTTAYAKDFFSIPPEFNTSFHKADDWEPFVRDRDLFMQSFQHSNIPERWLSIIHQALQPKPQAAAIHVELDRELDQPPSLEEFKKSIRKAKTNSAPGPSGLSYNMAKSWPETMVEYVHSCMSKFWIHSTVPASWNWKWLNYIPKVASDNLRLPDLRPLMLIEILRKLWSSHIGAKTMGALYRHKVLDDAHHGFVASRGTGTATLLHINQSEDVEEKDQISHSTSYDAKQAFDSIFKAAIIWSQRRLGVPRKVAQFLAEMDNNSTIVVRTEFAKHLWDLSPYHSVHTNGDYPAGLPTPLPDSFQIESFDAERGTGQGDPHSPAKYLFCDDIIATGLRILDDEAPSTYVGAEDYEVYVHDDIGYADDKESTSHSDEHIQLKAELFSAFTIVFGLKFSQSKIRRVFKNFLPSSVQHKVNDMLIYTSGWVPVPIAVTTTGATVYLGGIYDTDNSGKGALDHMLQTAQLHCNALKYTRFSPEAKITVATTSTVNKLKYTWETSSLAHTDAARIDRVLDDAFITTTRNMQSYPRKLLHIPRHLGGLGLVQFSTIGESGKLTKLFGCMRSYQNYGKAARGMLSRMARKMGIHSSPGQGFTITPRPLDRHEQKLYVDGPQQWLAEHGMYLSRHGLRGSADSMASLLPNIIPVNSSLRKTCYDLQLYTLSDLTEDTPTGRTWWTLPAELDPIRPFLPQDTPLGSPPLLVGQYWRLDQGIIYNHTAILKVGDVIRIDGKIGINVLLTRYRLLPHARLRLVQHIPGSLELPYSQVFSTSQAVRCTVQQHKQDVYAVTNERRQSAPTWMSMPDLSPPHWIQLVQRELFHVHSAGEYSARPYTDGAFKKLASIPGYFRSSLAPRQASAAIIIKDDTSNWKRKPVIAVHIDQGQSLRPDSVYSLEFLALAGALQLSQHSPDLLDVASDAKSIIELLPNRRNRLQNVTKDHHYLLQCIDNALHSGARLPYHVAGHAERRKPAKNAQGCYGDTWTKDDWGNWIADRVAASDYDTLTSHGIRLTLITVQARDIYDSLAAPGQWYIGDKDGRPVLPAGVTTVAAESLATLYHQERDAFRIKGGRDPMWETDSTMTHAAEIFQLRRASASHASTKTRIIYNKGFHGGNRAKDDSLTPEEKSNIGACILCQQPDSQDHWLHTCPHSTVDKIRQEVFADLNRILMAYHGKGTLHHQVGQAFKSILQTTAQPSRIWTANWSQLQIAALERSINPDLLRGLEMKDFSKILQPLERILAEGALSLWHMKQCEEKRRTALRQPSPRSGLPRRSLTNVPQPDPPSSPTLERPGSLYRHPRRPPMSRVKRRQERVPIQGRRQLVNQRMIQFPALTQAQVNRLARVCHTERASLVPTRITSLLHGVHPISGREFQRIYVNETGRFHDAGFFNDAIISAYLTLVESTIPTLLKVAPPVATAKLLDRDYPEVLRHLRYNTTRRASGKFGDHKWLFFIFNIKKNGRGFHWVSVGINTAQRFYTYYDYAKSNRERTEHLAAVKDFLTHMDTLMGNATSPWREDANGTRDMVTQPPNTDCGPGTCFIIEAIAQSLPLTVFTTDTIHAGRKYIAICLLERQVTPMSTLIVNSASTIPQTPLPEEASNAAAASSTTPAGHDGHWIDRDYNILHPAFAYDPYIDDDPSNSAYFRYPVNNRNLCIPELSADQRQEILIRSAEVMTTYHNNGENSIIGSDLQDLIRPEGISGTIVDFIMRTLLGPQLDVTYVSVDAMHALAQCQQNYDQLHLSPSISDEWQQIQSTILRTRYVVFAYRAPDPHFVGAILDRHTSELAQPALYYFDSFHSTSGGAYTTVVNTAKSLLDWTHQQNQSSSDSNRWTVVSDMTRCMERQRPYRRPSDHPWDGTQIDCGVYLIMMFQLFFEGSALTALTPTAVNKYRSHIAYKILHPDIDISLSRWIPSTSSDTTSDPPSHPATVPPSSPDDASPECVHEPITGTSPTAPPGFPPPDQMLTSTLASVEPSIVPFLDSICKDTSGRQLRPRLLQPSTRELPSQIPDNRKVFDVPTDDPAALYTYAAESSIPGAGWGLYARRLIGPSSPEDDGEIIGEYYGRTLTEEEIRIYMYDPDPSINTGFMIYFQGLAVDAWDHDKGCYTCMSALLNDCLDTDRYNAEWIKKEVNGRTGLFTSAFKDITSHNEGFIEYGSISFCRASYPIDVLFKAVAHYYDQIVRSEEERNYWNRLPQARYLFNSPYHTCKPSQRLLVLDRIEHHFRQCSNGSCSCDIQHYFDSIQAQLTDQASKKRKRATSTSQRARPRLKHLQELRVPIPDSSNINYDRRLLVKSAEELSDAGDGLYAIAHINAGDIIGIYENHRGGKRLNAQRIKDTQHQSAYAVEHNGLVRDAWDPINRRPCCKVASANDCMDKDKDNAKLGINENFPLTLLMIATTDIPGTLEHPVPIYLPYGGPFWCDNSHSTQLHIMAIRRYAIDIHTSTDETDGDWTMLHDYEQLCQIFPRPTDAQALSDTPSDPVLSQLTLTERELPFSHADRPKPRCGQSKKKKATTSTGAKRQRPRKKNDSTPSPQTGFSWSLQGPEELPVATISNTHDAPAIFSIQDSDSWIAERRTDASLYQHEDEEPPALSKREARSRKRKAKTKTTTAKDARQRTMDSFFQVVAHAGGRTNEEAAAQERIDSVDVNVSTDMPCPDFPMTAADSGILLFFSPNASIAPLVDSQTAPPRHAYDDTDRLASVDRPEDTNMRSSSGGGAGLTDLSPRTVGQSICHALTWSTTNGLCLFK